MKGIKDAHIGSQRQQQAPEAVPPITQMITECRLRDELRLAIQHLGPQGAAKVVVSAFRLAGLPKELRRHL